MSERIRGIPPGNRPETLKIALREKYSPPLGEKVFSIPAPRYGQPEARVAEPEVSEELYETAGVIARGGIANLVSGKTREAAAGGLLLLTVAAACASPASQEVAAAEPEGAGPQTEQVAPPTKPSPVATATVEATATKAATAIIPTEKAATPTPTPEVRREGFGGLEELTDEEKRAVEELEGELSRAISDAKLNPKDTTIVLTHGSTEGSVGGYVYYSVNPDTDVDDEYYVLNSEGKLVEVKLWGRRQGDWNPDTKRFEWKDDNGEVMGWFDPDEEKVKEPSHQVEGPATSYTEEQLVEFGYARDSQNMGNGEVEVLTSPLTLYGNIRIIERWRVGNFEFDMTESMRRALEKNPQVAGKSFRPSQVLEGSNLQIADVGDLMHAYNLGMTEEEFRERLADPEASLAYEYVDAEGNSLGIVNGRLPIRVVATGPGEALQFGDPGFVRSKVFIDERGGLTLVMSPTGSIINSNVGDSIGGEACSIGVFPRFRKPYDYLEAPRLADETVLEKCGLPFVQERPLIELR